MTLKIDPFTVVLLIVLLLSGGGGFTGGYLIGKRQTTVINQYITQENKQVQEVNTIAASILVDIETSQTNIRIDYDFRNLTNISITSYSNISTN